MSRIFTPVPTFADCYPNRVETVEHMRLPFYCCNCHRKEATAYLTDNFGPFCAECLEEVEPLMAQSEGGGPS